MILHMVPETKLAFLMPGACHIMHVPDPPLPDRSHFGSVDRTLALIRVGGIGNLPFAGSARFACTFLYVELSLNNCHNRSPYLLIWINAPGVP
jgi:hypothetical protein